MSTIVFCNIGTRDVARQSEDPRTRPRARVHGEQLLGQMPTVAGELEFPILQPAFEYILQETQGHLDHVFFIGTNQKSPEYYQGDTLYYAQLAAQVFAPRYRGQMGQVAALEVGEEPPINPSLYDEAFEVYGRLLEPYAHKTTICYVVPVGGIPACNTALLWQGARLFGERCRPVFVVEKERRAYPLRAATQITAVLQENTAHHLLSRFEFAAAHALLSVARPVNDPLLHLLQYAAARLSFDFASAQHHLRLAIQQARGEIRRQISDQFEHGLQPLLAQEPLALLGELYHNALVAWENGRYVDFLGRVVRFQEGLWQQVAVELHQTGKLKKLYTADKLGNSDVREWLLDQLDELASSETPSTHTLPLAHLRQILAEAFSLNELSSLCFDVGIKYEELSGDTLSVKVRELLDYALRHGRWQQVRDAVVNARPHLAQEFSPGNGRFATFAQVLRRLERLVSLRQQSIIAHGYEGVSADKLRQVYNTQAETADSPTQDMFAICDLLGIAVNNPFLQLREFITSHLHTPHA